MCTFEDLGLRSSSLDEGATTHILGSMKETAEVDHGKGVSITKGDDYANEQSSDSLNFATLQTLLKSVAKTNTKTAYLNLGFDSLKLATVKLMDPLKRCMVTPDSPRTCLIEEVRSKQDGELPKLLEYHLEKFELNDYLPFDAMLLVAHGTTSLFQSINMDGLTFSSLPYELKGLKMIAHQQKLALPRLQRAESSYFSKVEIQDCSTESLKERGLRQLRFHKRSSQYGWQCFINENDPKHMSMFGNSELSPFEHIMAATIEVFEYGRRLHKSRPLQSNQIQQCEGIARANYLRHIKRKRIALEGWGQHLAYVEVQPYPALHTRRLSLNVFGAPRKERVGSKQKQQLAVEANAETSCGTPSTFLDAEFGTEASAEEGKNSDKVGDRYGKRKALSVDARDSRNGKDISVNTLSPNAQKEGKGKGLTNGKGPQNSHNTMDLAQQPAQKTVDEDDVAAPKKSGSSAVSRQHWPLNTAKRPDPFLHPIYNHASRSSSHNTEITDSTALVSAEAAKMDELSGQVPTMALKGGQERADEDRPRLNNSTGDDKGWQTVTHGKTRKSADQYAAPLTPPLRRGALAVTNRARSTGNDRLAPDFATSESSSSSHPALKADAADVASALNAREFPSLPTITQSEEALEKVMAKKKKKKDKRKKKMSALESESSQSSNGLPEYVSAEAPEVTSQELTTNSRSQLLVNLVQKDAQRCQGHGADSAADAADEEITPNASIINLAASASQLGSATDPASISASLAGSTGVSIPAGASQPASPSATPSTSADQPKSTSNPPLASVNKLHPTSAPLLATTPATRLVHKFGSLEGPGRIVCRMPGCDNTTSPWDGSTVICPYCGPYSSIRYCCTDHLLSDTTDHWGVDCMKYTCHHLCDAPTIHPRQVQCPPAIPNICGWNTPERHRQAVYHAHSSKKNGFAEIEGDYFIFTDAEEWIQAGSPDRRAWGLYRARGAVHLVVSFNDERSPSFLKDRFNRLLNISLFTGASNALLLDHLFLMIRENLLSKGEWDDTVLESVAYQFQWEFGYRVPESIIDNLRHACAYQWLGTPVDQCHNRICNREMLQPGTRHPLSPRFSLREKAEELERRYWILRVARVYHPSVRDPAQRMRGVGCSFVAPENRRMFRMGREWDGFPSGTMEIEGAIWVPDDGGGPRLQVANLITVTV